MTPEIFAGIYFGVAFLIFFIGMVHGFLLEESEDKHIDTYGFLSFLWPLVVAVGPFVLLAYGVAHLIKKFRR